MSIASDVYTPWCLQCVFQYYRSHDRSFENSFEKCLNSRNSRLYTYTFCLHNHSNEWLLNVNFYLHYVPLQECNLLIKKIVYVYCCQHTTNSFLMAHFFPIYFSTEDHHLLTVLCTITVDMSLPPSQ